jgi:hypothetical protein
MSTLNIFLCESCNCLAGVSMTADGKVQVQTCDCVK